MDLVAVPGRAGAPVVADRQRQEVEHEVRVGDLVVGPGEPAALEVVGRARPAPQEEPLRPDERPPPQLRRRRLHRHRLERLVLDVDLEVVLQVRPDPGQVGDDRDAEGAEIVGPPHPGQLEELRRVDRPAGEDDLAAFDPLGAAAPPLDVDGDGAPPSKTTPVTNVRVRTVRFFRPRTGFRYACAADSRRPLWMFRSNGAKPSCR